MDTDTTDIDLSELTSDFAPSDGTEAAGESGGAQETDTTGEDADSTGTEAQNVAQGSGDDGQQAEAPLDLARLQALAEKRRAERPAAKQEPEKAEAPPLTAEAIAQAVKGTDSFRKGVAEALKAGDIEALSRVASEVDPALADAAGVFEKLVRGASNPDATRMTDTIRELKAELAEVKKQLPDDVLTTSKYEEMRKQVEAEQAYAANRSAFLSGVADADQCPTLSKVAESARLEYGRRAQILLEDAGHPPTTENLLRIAEQVASSELGGLLAQNQGAASKTEGGSESTKAAGAATAGKTEVSGEIDNRAASTTSATTPDPDDEDAWERRLTSIAEGSRAQ